MTDADFLAAIVAHPADDAPRLIYADWLEEHGQPERAEFIRVQCELAKHLRVTADQELTPGIISRLNSFIASKMGDEALARLHGRERELLSFLTICKPMPSPFRYVQLINRYPCPVPSFRYSIQPNMTNPLDAEFRRGFIAEVSLACEDWLKYGPRLVRECPLERVVLSDKRPWEGASTLEHPRYEWLLRRDELDRPSDVPRCLFVNFNPDRERLSQASIASFGFANDAFAALSQACLAWAKSQLPVSVAM